MNIHHGFRLRFRKALLAGLPAALLGASAAMAQSPIEIGLITPKQGPSASIGINMAQGAELALAERGGKVMGEPVQTVWLDEASPQVAAQNMQKLHDQYKAVAVIGGNSSASVLAMMAVAKQDKLPFISAGAAASEITGASCNRYTFRDQAPSPVQVAAAFKMLHGKKIYFLTPSYAFGQDVLKNGRAMLASADATEVGSNSVPVNTADYSSYVLKIREAMPDAIFTALVGLDLSNFMKQMDEMELKGKIPVYGVAVSDTDFWDIGPKAAAGTYIKPWYYNDPANPAPEKAFVKAYETKYGQPPSDKAFFGWFSMNATLDSIQAAQSTDPAKLVTALENWHYKAGIFPYYFRGFDHQLIRPSVIVKVKNKITDKWDYMDVVGWTSNDQASTEKAFGTEQEIGCKMGSL